MPICKDFGKELLDCHARASQCEAQAQSAADEQARKDLLRSRDKWFRRAHGFEVARNFLKSLPSETPSQSKSPGRPGKSSPPRCAVDTLVKIKDLRVIEEARLILSDLKKPTIQAPRIVIAASKSSFGAKTATPSSACCGPATGLRKLAPYSMKL